MRKYMVNNNESSEGLSNLDSSSVFSIDGHPESVPAAGWRNGSSLNNAGENGNYWSSMPYESDAQNAYNLNFNSDNHNVGWNNRNNDHSVRPVSELTCSPSSRHFSLTPEKLLIDLHCAYLDARKHKRSRNYQLRFEFNLEDNLVRLRDELYARIYKPGPSTCFIIHEPKMREVFAADFRDRVVHHLLYNYSHTLFENTFIHDAYSCIEGRGTHFGINRLKHHIRSVSQGFSSPCYVLKIDLKGYFMSIRREILFAICHKTLLKMRSHRSPNGRRWDETVDLDFVLYLLDIIVNADPLLDCKVVGNSEEWAALPAEKSLFCSPDGCGLPIGNLSSQLFSNIYLNEFDQFMKRNQCCEHYGRYVDDAYVVDSDAEHLKAMLLPISEFLKNRLGLELNMRKTRIVDVNQGVEFLGAFIKPFRTYVSNSSLSRINRKMFSKQKVSPHLQSSVNSCLGVLSHYDSYRLRKVLYGYRCRLPSFGDFDRDYLRFYPYP